jgi:hypothetical protein
MVVMIICSSSLGLHGVGIGYRPFTRADHDRVPRSDDRDRAL